MTETSPGVWVSIEQAQLLRDMCVNATAQDAKTKIKIGETQMALEEQLQSLNVASAAAPPRAVNRRERRAQERRLGGRPAKQNGDVPPSLAIPVDHKLEAERPLS